MCYTELGKIEPPLCMENYFDFGEGKIGPPEITTFRLDQ